MRRYLFGPLAFRFHIGYPIRMPERGLSPNNAPDRWPEDPPFSFVLDQDVRGKYRADVVVHGKRLMLACLEGMPVYEVFFPGLILDDSAHERGIWDYSLRLSGNGDFSVEIFEEAVRLAAKTDSLQDLYLATAKYVDTALREEGEREFLAGRKILDDQPISAERQVNGMRLAFAWDPARAEYVLRLPPLVQDDVWGTLDHLVPIGRDPEDARDAFSFALEVAARVADPEAVVRAVSAYVRPAGS